MRIVNGLIPRTIKDKLKYSPLGLVKSLYEKIQFFRGHRFCGQLLKTPFFSFSQNTIRGFIMILAQVNLKEVKTHKFFIEGLVGVEYL